MAIKSSLYPEAAHRQTIGLLVDWSEDRYQMNLIRGVNDFCKKNDLNLLCFEGGSLKSRYSYESEKNFLYSLVSDSNVDGLIILAATLGHYVELEEITRFCEQFLPIPVVSVALYLETVPSILVDNSIGMRELVTHLIEVHNYKRFAFVKGPSSNQDAGQRYYIFNEVLRAYGITLHEECIVEGNFTSDSGVEAVKVLLDDRKADFQVIVAANDDMALGVLNELNNRGVRVPEELAVVGFDGLDISVYSSPPLTTVCQSMYAQGVKAAETVWDLVLGRAVSKKIILPTKLIPRESCGCFSKVTLSAAVENSEKDTSSLNELFINSKSDFVLEIMKAVKDLSIYQSETELPFILEEILDAFYLSLSGEDEGAFLKSWLHVMCKVFWLRGDLSAWHTIITRIRKTTLPFLQDRLQLIKAEDLWHQVRVLISEKALLEERYKNHISMKERRTLSYLREELLVTMDEGKLMEILARRLPEVGITGCCLALFEYAVKPVAARLMMAYNGNEVFSLPPGGEYFSTEKIVPSCLDVSGGRYSRLVSSLSLTTEQSGYVVFDMNPEEGRLYGSLRRIISSTLKGVMLLKKVRAQTLNLKSQKKRLTGILVDLRKAMSGFVQTMALTVENRDPYTAGHQRQVADLAKRIAERMKLPFDIVEGVGMAGIIHDLGKIYVPAEILNKPGRLKQIEFNLIKIHPEVAYDILKSIEFPWPIADIILQHHEKWDGSGYPSGLSGEDILIESRIISVADVVEAMASHRPYRASLGMERALEEITANRNVFYDPQVVDACLKVFKEDGYELELVQVGGSRPEELKI